MAPSISQEEPSDDHIRSIRSIRTDQRMTEDMNMRRFSQDTQRDYIRDVGRFATFLGRSPDTATAEDIRRFQVPGGAA